MKHLRTIKYLGIFGLTAILWGCATAKPAPAHDAVKPVPRQDKWWQDRHANCLKQAAAGDIGVIFIGDSITQGWEGAGKEEWAKHFGPLKPLNLGFSGDRTQHVLWRLDNGEVDGISPKAAVIMIGTNNSKDNSAQEIADGIEAIVKELREKQPKMQILLLAVFPRSEKPDELRNKLIEVNKLIEKLDRQRKVTFLDIGPKFVQPDGTISKDIMPDFLHLSPSGYKLWAESIEPALQKLMKK
ncbi:GDSL family lipase [Candidatus Sumerlaeota bacterium]|nr:GDSL family lipase [Candidatus Sumerlaeota bacterium]